MTVYRTPPQDVRHGGLAIVAEALTGGLQRLCDAFAEDGYETVAGGDPEALLDALAGPRFLIGLGGEAALAWEAACRREDLTAAAMLYPRGLLAGKPLCPVILQVSKQAGETPEADYPVFAYAAAPGFLLDDDPAYDSDASKVAILRTLALFRRSVGRGES
jgi:hypothetical protein